jgi:hypothetical protein
MTNQNISRFFGLLASTLLTINSFAQVSEFKNLQPSTLNSSHVKVYQNILDEFDQQFAGAENIKWSRLNKNFLSTFKKDDQEFRVLFTPQAKLVYKISFGKEKHLPVHLRKAVKRMYVEFVISAAIKVEEAGRTVWVIHLEDEKNLVTIKVLDDEVIQTLEYIKG